VPAARCGDVLWLFDGTARDAPKARMFVCLDPEQGWCARIVSRPPRHEPVAISRNDHPFLDHDSYIETGIPIEFLEDELADAIAAGRRVGRISADAARSIVAAWQRARVTPPYARDAVIRRVKEEFGIA
jgi:hypothetical protein